MRVRISDAAEGELEEIGNFIARDSSRRANSFVLELLDRARLLAHHPRRYPIVPGLEQIGLRRCPYGAYVILYVLGEEEIEIAHIFHGARDYLRTLYPED